MLCGQLERPPHQRCAFGIKNQARLFRFRVAVQVPEWCPVRPAANRQRRRHTRLRPLRFHVVIELRNDRHQVLIQPTGRSVVYPLCDAPQGNAALVQLRSDSKMIMRIPRKSRNVVDHDNVDPALVLLAVLKHRQELRAVGRLRRLAAIRELSVHREPVRLAVMPARFKLRSQTQVLDLFYRAHAGINHGCRRHRRYLRCRLKWSITAVRSALPRGM